MGGTIDREHFALVLGCLREAIAFAAIIFALSGLDDLFVDAVFLVRSAVRLAGFHGRYRRITAEEMGRAEPRPLAIFVPAWDEAAVIGTMLRGVTSTWQHPSFRVFVGCYPNDPATIAAVDGVGDPRIERVMTTRSGPTTKADCLNHLWRAALAWERQAGRRFAAMVLHDAEDVVHPRELHVYDHLIGRFQMVQLPVEPIPDAASRWIAGHYLDEFAENHAKDVVVREAIGAAVPSAGVACAIEREMLARIAGADCRNPFDPSCFTEDYELGLRIKRLGGTGILVRVRDRRGQLVATHEHFPDTLQASVRQKSRWLIGIALDGWDRLGWTGNGWDHYMLWRDRKALFTAPALVLAYCSSLGWLAARLAMAGDPALAAEGPVVAPEGPLHVLLGLNAALLIWRLTLRALFTARAHGWREGVRAIPRAIVANLINTLALWRAGQRYLRIQSGRMTARWEKTAHRIPEPAR